MTAFFEAFSAFLATGTIWVYLVIFFGKIVEVSLGTLRIGVISSVQGTLFADWMRAYHARYPDVRISVSSANTYQLLSTLQNRQIDMAIIRTPFAADGLDVSFLKEEQIQAVGDERFFEGFSGEAASLHELAQTPLIVYRRWRRIILSAFEAAGVRPNILCAVQPLSFLLHIR